MPCYVLARNFRLDPITKAVLIEDPIQFAGCTATNGGDQVIVFSDFHLAQDYSHACADPSLHIVEFTSLVKVRELLVKLQCTYQKIWMDLNPKTARGQEFLISHLIVDFDRHIAQQEKKEGQ